MKLYSHSNSTRAKELWEEYSAIREAYRGLPIPNDNYFDTESVSRVIFDMKRGKAADIDGLTVEHLQYSHPVLAVLLSKFFKLIVSSHYIPASFKCSYIVPIPKVKYIL